MELKIALDTVWVVIAACLVFFMNAGFGMLETGFCQAKNAVNILAKNFIVFSVAAIAFWVTGFALMFGDGNGLFGMSGWFLIGPDNSPAVGEAYVGVFSALNWTGVPLTAKFFFQLAFAATAATIVSGAVAERIKFFSYIAFFFVLVAIIYPIGGHWVWGGGWLSQLGFSDFAGSTVVHSVGGWAALVGACLLGARAGKYLPNGEVRPIPGHNMSLATLGTFVLWLGWFGFNAGSTMEADPGAISAIAVNTLMAAASPDSRSKRTCTRSPSWMSAIAPGSSPTKISVDSTTATVRSTSPRVRSVSKPSSALTPPSVTMALTTRRSSTSSASSPVLSRAARAALKPSLMLSSAFSSATLDSSGDSSNTWVNRSTCLVMCPSSLSFSSASCLWFLSLAALSSACSARCFFFSTWA